MITEQDAIINNNKNLIYSMTHYFNGYTNKEDLFQVGAMELVKAARKYDDSKGSKLTTYAFPYMLGGMKKYIREDKGIKISRDITKLNLKIEKATILLAQRLMRQPTIIEVATELCLPVEMVAEAIKATNVIQSIDETLNSDEGKDISLHEMIPDENIRDLDTLITLKEAINQLDPLERKIIETRYLQDLTQMEVASLLGINQVQVSRSEKKVLSKLRTYMSA